MSAIIGAPTHIYALPAVLASTWHLLVRLLLYLFPPEEHTWMVIQHNNTELTRVRPPAGVNQQSVHFDYSSREEQLLAAISQSQHCEQELSYHCRKSRLLNSLGKARSYDTFPLWSSSFLQFQHVFAVSQCFHQVSVWLRTWRTEISFIFEWLCWCQKFVLFHSVFVIYFNNWKVNLTF